MEIPKLRKKKEKCQNEGNLSSLFCVCKDLADIYFRDEKFENALNEYKTMLEVSEALDNKMDVARANRMIGEVYCSMEKFEDALKHQIIHLNISREESDYVEVQRALATLGRTHFLWSEIYDASDCLKKANCLREANNYYLESLSVCERLKEELVGSTQKMEMKARLFLNLGLSHDSQASYHSAIDFLSKAVVICKKLDLWEDLFRTYCSLASVYQHCGDSKESLANYDLAMQIAVRLPDKIELLCDLLPMKAEILLNLPDFRGARQCLIKAYKLRSSKENSRMDIERKLRTVAAMCECEEKLLELLPEEENNERKKLYESIGDMAASLGNFCLALTYYHLMLEAVEKDRGNEKSHLDCYVSLAQTYVDDHNFLKAIEYFKMELALEKDNPLEASKTCLNIADCFERLERFEDMMKYYQQSKHYANKISNPKQLNTILRSMYNSLTACGKHMLAESIAKQLEENNFEDEEEVSSEEGEEIREFGAHISLEDLSDEEGGDSEEFDRPKASRSRLKTTNKIKRNEKGETLLHTAVISGNKTLVLKFLQQGHSVDVKDYGGWTPLHEACNHGFKEIAEVLINYGAAVNDRGGPLCDGVTPLLDAASNGCLDVVDLLLENGASPLTRTNKGESVLDCLSGWRDRYRRDVGSDLDQTSLVHFNALYNRLKGILEKAGQKVEMKKDSSPEEVRSARIHRRSDSMEQDSASSNLRVKTSPEKLITRKDRRNYLNDYSASSGTGLRKGLEDRRLSECKSKLTEATSEYETTMKALRHRTRPEKVSNIAKCSIPALLASEEVVDDWLEDDMQPSKKRKLTRPFSEGLTIRNIEPMSPISDISSAASSIVQEPEDSVDSEDRSIPDAPSPQQNDLGIPSTSGCSSNRLKVLNSSRRRQISLMASGVTREKVRRSEEADFGPTPPTTTSQLSHNPPSSAPPPVACVKIRVEDKLFLIAVHDGQQTIEWLAQQAVQRYHNLEGVEPELRLTTEDGALLDESDPVCVVFGCKEVLGVVQSWNIDSLTSLYMHICQNNSMKVDNRLVQMVEESQATGEINLSDSYFDICHLEPLLKTLSYHNGLRVLTLTGTNLGDHTFKLVVDCLAKLPLLESLDLSCTNITASSLSLLSSSVEQKRTLHVLKELYLGYNPLGECLPSLAVMLNHIPGLSGLHIPYIGLSSKDFRSPTHLTLGAIESLNLNDNNLGLEGIQEILGKLESNSLKCLQMRRTGKHTLVNIAMYLDIHHPPALTFLDISYCEASDHDINLLIEGLRHCPSMEEVRLDGCSGLNEESISTFLELPLNLTLTGVPTHLDVTSRLNSLSITSCSKQSLAKPGPFGYQSISL